MNTIKLSLPESTSRSDIKPPRLPSFTKRHSEAIISANQSDIPIRSLPISDYTDTGNISTALEQVDRNYQRSILLRAFINANLVTGGYMHLLPEYNFCPIIKGEGGQIVPLYHFIEVLDSLVCYAELKEEFPFLSYAQINGAILFIRKLAQSNVKGIDFDEEEDRELASNKELINELKQALSN